MRRDGTISLSDILLFDVGMKRVEQNPDIRVVDLIAQRHGVGSGIEEGSLEAVERLDGNCHVVPRQHRAERLIALHRPLPLVRRTAPSRQISHRRIQRSGDDLRAHFGRCLDAFFQVHARLLANRRIVRNHAQAARNHRTDGALELVLRKALANVGEREIHRMEHGNFDAVESVALDFGKQREILARKTDGPDESIDAVLHFLSPFASGLPGPKCFNITRSSLSLRLVTVTPRFAAPAVIKTSSCVIWHYRMTDGVSTSNLPTDPWPSTTITPYAAASRTATERPGRTVSSLAE